MFKYTNIIFIFITIFIVPSTSYSAGKFYKWTDKNGQIHYSQVAPQSKSNETDNVVKIGGNSSSIKMEPYEKGNYLYCGKLALPSAHLTDSLIIKNIKLGLKEWVKSQIEAEQEYTKVLQKNQLNKRSNKPKLRKAKTRLDETACRVTWANKRLTFLTSSSYKKGVARGKIKDKLKELKKMRDYDCPHNPNYLGRGVTWAKNYPNLLIGDEAEAYYQCNKKYDKKEKELKKYLK